MELTPKDVPTPIPDFEIVVRELAKPVYHDIGRGCQLVSWSAHLTQRPSTTCFGKTQARAVESLLVYSFNYAESIGGSEACRALVQACLPYIPESEVALRLTEPAVLTMPPISAQMEMDRLAISKARAIIQCNRKR